MTKHIVTTTIEVDAENPHEAAAIAAAKLTTDPPAAYTVRDAMQYTFHVSLDPEELKTVANGSDH